jgi:hypothetical protein
MKTIFILLTCFLASCVNYHVTSDEGLRVNNPRVFKYNKPRFTKLDKGLIDTNAIYYKDSSYFKWNHTPWNTSSKEFVRFFNTGQVLFVYSKGFPTIDRINNPNVGIPGYFIVNGTELKIDRLEIINGGQTAPYFGRIQPNGDIIFYEEGPKLYNGSFSKLEKYQKDVRYSIWRKKNVDGIKHYRPNW